MIQLILANAAELRRLHEAIDSAFRQRTKGPAAREAWSRACDAFHSSYDRLAWPRGLQAGMHNLRTHDPEAIETAVAFLEADPVFHRSGYIKVDVIRRLKSARLTPHQADRLRAVVLIRAQGPHRREFRAFCRLGAHLSTPAQTAAVAGLLDDPDPRTARHAKWLLAALRSAGDTGVAT